MEKVLLTGGAGYIGSHTAVALIEAGYEPVLVDDFSNSYGDVPARIEKITGRKPICYEADVSSVHDMERLFQENDFEGVMHFAGYKSVPESMAKPEAYYDSNLGSARAVLDLMKKYHSKVIIFGSSATVYSEDAELPYTEDITPLAGKSPYAKSKLMIEQMIESESNENQDLSAVLLRYFNPVGAHESSVLGENPKKKFGNLMPAICRAASGEEKRLRVYGDDFDTADGTCVRDYVHVMDIAEGHVAALDHALQHSGTIAINLGAGRGYSVLEMIHSFEEATGKAVPYEIAERRIGDIDAYYAGVERAQSVLSWKARRTIRDMCVDAWNWEGMRTKARDR